MSSKYLAGIVAFFGVIAFSFSFSLADEPRIIDVRRNIPLADTDPIYKDYYIKMDPGSALKPDLVVTAVRKVSIREATGVNPLGELSIPVGQLKIIFIENNLAVAREAKLLSRDALPMLDQIGIMTGDVIDLKTAK